MLARMGLCARFPGPGVVAYRVATPGPGRRGAVIEHIVLLKVKKDVSEERVGEVFAALAALQDAIPGILSFKWGPYSSDEGLHRGYTHGFVMEFETAAHRDAYLPHPEHERVKAIVGAVLEGGIDGVVAFDFEA